MIAETGRILAIVPHRDQGAIQAVFPAAIHVLDRFHLIQFFTDAQQRRSRYLSDAKKHHKSRFIDRFLARKPEELTAEEREFVQEWHREE